jgi:glycosyltransferase involved in cell wall biosynthesis
MSGNNSTTMPLVSIIMNCYNGEKYLREAIDSVISQTYINWELIFWDNQSTDDSSMIVKSYGDDRIKYVLAGQFTTLGTARNLAVEVAQGEWIGFLDTDDLWVEDKLKLQLEKVFTDEKLAMVYGKATFFSNENLKFINITRTDLPEGDIFEELAKQNFISLSSALVNKSKYWEVNGIESKYNQAEDFDLFIKISFNSKVGVVNKTVVKNRIHSNNLSAFQKDMSFTESIEILMRYLPDTRALKGLNYWSSLYMLVCIRRFKFTKHSVLFFKKYGSINELVRLTVKIINRKVQK